MKRVHQRVGSEGMSLLEMMMAVAIFLLLCAAAFGLLQMSQKNYQTQSQVLNAFQEARFGMDQIVRDVNDSGYPPPSLFATLPTGSQVNLYASTPVAWSPNYPGTSCTLGGSCITPGDFDLIIETNIDPQNDNVVDWVRYKLQGNTLLRGVADKAQGQDPDVTTANVLVPYVQNVMNSAPAAQIAQFKTLYPAMYPGGVPVPVFSYTCDTAAGLVSCDLAGADNSPVNVRDVEITLIVMAPKPDAQTGQPRLVELHGRGHRSNPTQ